MSAKILQMVGGCMCGCVRFEAIGEPHRGINCHCESCRKHTGAPGVTLAVYRIEQVNFSGRERKSYQSSANASRAFCDECGTPLTWETSLGDLGKICALHVSTFDDPNALVPSAHSFYTEKLSWFDFADNLPRYESFVMDGVLVRHGPEPMDPSD